MKILVGSINPVKINATREAFSLFFKEVEVIGLNIESGVAAQPIDIETFEGARNRADRLKTLNEKENLGAEYFVGIEGGITKRYAIWFAFGAMCILNADGKSGMGTTIHFMLPKKVIYQIHQGIELGDIMDQLSGKHNTKQKGGAIEYFTLGEIDRKMIYKDGLIAALIPFLSDAFDS